MADKVIQVNVTSTKSQRVSVSPGNVQNEISATPDSSLYYSNLAKNWAIASGLILNEDYSSKHYAQESANSASSAKNYADASHVTYTSVQNVANTALTDIEDARVEAVESVTAIATTGVASVEAKTTVGVELVNATQTTAVNAVNTSKTEALNAINQIGVNNLANKDLSNLSATGEARFASGLNNKITNCLLEVPQNIKLELNNGTLTLKAGSKVIVPNGAGVFEEVTITKDLSTTGYHDGKIMILAQCSSATSINAITEVLTLNATSGTTNPASGIYYNTSSNTIYRYKNSVADLQFALPLAICTRTSGIITSIDQVFNGMGYIGSTVWVDKGVKGLIPNGRNEDGSLNNAEFTTSKVFTYTFATSVNFTNLLPCLYMDFPTKPEITFNGEIKGVDYIAIRSIGGTQPSDDWWFDEQNNYWKYGGVISRWLPVANCDVTSDVVSNFQPKQPFRAVDYNDALLKSDKSEIVSWGMPDYSAGISVDITTTAKSFTAPCDGLYVTNIYTDGNTFLIINGVSSPFGSTDSGTGMFTDSLTIPLNAGDVIKWDKNLYSSKAFTSVFYPLKGAN